MSPPGFDGVIVYELLPKPVNEYVPGLPVVSETFGEPAALTSTPETKRGPGGDPMALP